MDVKELIEMLSQFSPELKVRGKVDPLPFFSYISLSQVDEDTLELYIPKEKSNA